MEREEVRDAEKKRREKGWTEGGDMFNGMD